MEKTISLNEEDFYKEFDKNIISIKVENDPKVYQLEKQLYENFEIYFTGDIKNISLINSKISTFSQFLILKLFGMTIDYRNLHLRLTKMVLKNIIKTKKVKILPQILRKVSFAKLI